ncbi:RagB/SusD family nutrient uptake outer membrane protein [Nibrella saemangeumensis]
MKRYTKLILLTLITLVSCREVLEPQPVDLLVDQLALNEPADVETVRIGLYSSLRGMAAPMIIAGDFTADYIQHNGTFTDYRELGTKQITAANGAVSALWSAMYRTIYVANFIIERLPEVSGVRDQTRRQVLAEARFMRGFAYFVGAHTYGAVPKVTNTDQTANRNIGRTPKAEILAFALEDYQAALADAPDEAASAAYVSKNVVRAALARYYLYQKNWAQAEQFATQVIDSKAYTLESDYQTIVTADFTDESILEVGYTVSDDPGTSTFGLNNILVGRREVIPSNQVVVALISPEAGTRRSTITFNSQQLKGSDNGWTVRKYGSADEDNNNIVLFRLAEMYLIRAEARAQLGRLSGANGALADLNVLRNRASVTALTSGSQADILSAIERERIYELAFEGHRWYDLVRTGRAQAVMTAFSPNWNSRYELWPVPQSEIQRNPALKGNQNPGY